MLRLLSCVWAAAPSGQPRTQCGQAGLKEGCEVTVCLIWEGGQKNPFFGTAGKVWVP